MDYEVTPAESGNGYSIRIRTSDEERRLRRERYERESKEALKRYQKIRNLRP